MVPRAQTDSPDLAVLGERPPRSARAQAEGGEASTGSSWALGKGPPRSARAQAARSAGGVEGGLERRACTLALALAAAVVGGCAHGSGTKTSESGEGGSQASVEVRKSLARQMVARQDWKRAFELVSALHRDRPKDPEVLALRGVVYREQGLMREAKQDFEASLKERDDDAYAHSALAVLLDQLGEMEAAGKHHQKAAELDAQNPNYLNNLGFSFFMRRKYDAAIASYQQALRLNPTDARIRNNLGFAHARKGDFMFAADEFRRAGSASEAKNNLGLAYELDGNLAQAFELYVQAVRLDPRARQPRSNLEQLARRLGRQVPADLAAPQAATVVKEQ